MKESAAIAFIQRRVQRHAGIAFVRLTPKERRQLFEQALRKRALEAGFPRIVDYLKNLYEEQRNAPRDLSFECDAILAHLDCHRTRFFRHPENWKSLIRDVLPQFHELIGKRALRVLSVGCSIGKEPYSLALFLNRRLGSARKKMSYSIHGVDLDERVLARARAGLFSKKEILREVPRQFHVDFENLSSVSNSKWCAIAPTVRSKVTFRKENLLHDCRSKRKYDIILCQNVFWYLTPSDQKRLLLAIRKRGADKSFLVVSPNDSMKRKNAFGSAIAKNVFQRAD